MTEQEEHYVHFAMCITWLNDSWGLLHAIEDQPNNPLRWAAFRFALIEYSKPYKLSHGSTKNFKLDTSLIPTELLPLHERIINSRDQVHAHSDITVMEAKLHVHESMGERYTLISQNRITGVEELPNLKKVIELIEATLDSMYEKEKILQAGLP